MKKILNFYFYLANSNKFDSKSEIMFPNKSGLLINALLVSLEDSDSFIRRNALEYIIHNFDISENQPLNDM